MERATVAAGIVLVGVIPRLLLAAGILPPWLKPFVWSDVLYTWERGLTGGRIPYWNAYFEYPPLDGYLAALFSVLTRNAFIYVALWAVLQIAAAAVVGLALARCGRRGWLWAAAPQLALFGPINFDLLAVAGLVLALRWDAAGASLRSAAALAAGTAAKLFPAVVLPVLLIRAARPRAAAAQVGVFVLLLAVLYLPAASAPFSSGDTVARYSVGLRANFDSFWGLVAKVFDGIGLPSAPTILGISTLGLFVTFVAAVVPAARSTRDAAAPAALAVVSLLLWAPLYSPQYSLWVLPFFALVPIPVKWFLALLVPDIAVFLTVYPLGLVHWPTGTDPLGTALLAILSAAVAGRQVALLSIWLALWKLTSSSASRYFRRQTSDPATTS